MKLSELLKNIPVIETNTSNEQEITGVSYDSRTTKKGDLFVAITGYETDGHKYIPMAVEKGACCVLCERKPEGNIPFLLVEDSRAALARLGQNWFGNPAASMKMVGITGTNGKTTTTYLLKDLLEKCLGAKVGLIGTNQNMIGSEVLHTERTTPESFELQALFRSMADAGCTHVVMEVSSHALCLQRVAGIQFAAGLFLNLSQDHLDFHKTMENYCDAKALLFRQCDYGIFNADDPWAERATKNAPCPLFSFGEKAGDLTARNIRLSSSSPSVKNQENFPQKISGWLLTACPLTRCAVRKPSRSMSVSQADSRFTMHWAFWRRLRFWVFRSLTGRGLWLSAPGSKAGLKSFRCLGILPF